MKRSIRDRGAIVMDRQVQKMFCSNESGYAVLGV